MDRVEWCEIERLRGERFDERGAALLGVTEEDVFLRREVPEEGARRHLARIRDLLDGGAVESLPREEVHRRVVECLSGACLLPLAQTDDGGDSCHVTILTQTST